MSMNSHDGFNLGSKPKIHHRHQVKETVILYQFSLSAKENVHNKIVSGKGLKGKAAG